MPVALENPHTLPDTEFLKLLGASTHGLAEQEAEKRLEQYGRNRFKFERKYRALHILARQFSNILIILLIISAVLAYFVGEVTDAVGILVAVFLSVLFGFFQEYKAEKALEALQAVAAPRTTVVRGGREIEIDSEEVVPGDLVILDEGNLVPADCRIIEGANAAVDQSALTGESVPVSKHPGKLGEKIPMAERKNLLYAGTMVVRGHCRAIAYATGFSTELGKIAQKLASTSDEMTPLQKQLDSLGKTIGKLAIALSLIFFFAGVLQGAPTVEMLLVVVVLIVVAIPEGLPTVLAITMAIGVQRMARHNAIVRKLPTVEALGSATFICTDKTGTLTENRMTLRRVYTQGKTYFIGGESLQLEGEIRRIGKNNKMSKPTDKEFEQLQFALSCGALCNSASLIYSESGVLGSVRGDPTEVALLVAAKKAGIPVSSLKGDKRKVGEIPFEYSRKMMSQIRSEGNNWRAYTKGAPEVVLSKCNRILDKGKVRRMTVIDRKNIKKQWESFSKGALRTLALAYRDMKHTPLGKGPSIFDKESVEKNLVWVGLAGSIDPPRPEVSGAIAACKKAGIRVMMITGDSVETAKVIATRIGLYDGKGIVIDGSHIDEMSDAQLKEKARDIVVCARATPDHKFRIVSALKELGEVVAVTGDGVNDAPSIRKSDIGIAMGIGGTDVARGAADMILTDNNFNTIVLAIRRGRSIYDNIKAFVRFQFATNFSALSLMLTTNFLGMPLPLGPLQLLWINIIMDGPPALALGMEPEGPNAMNNPPRKPKAPFLSPPLIHNIISSGLVMFGITIAVFALYLNYSTFALATSVTFTTFVVLQLVNAFNCRSLTQSAFNNLFGNKYLVSAVLISFLLQLAILFVQPLQEMFETVPLGAVDWAVVALSAATLLIFAEIKKKIIKNAKKSK